MAKLIVFYSRAGENYFGGKYRTVPVGNTEKVARLLAEKTCCGWSRSSPIPMTIEPVWPRPRRT